MKKLYYLLFVSLSVLFSCKKEVQSQKAIAQESTNTVKYAKGLEIYNYQGYSVVKITQPWPGAKESYTYIMQQEGASIPDSLKQFTTIPVPLKSVVVTSTTHIPSLEILGVENTLTGFPGLDYISSVNTRKRIDGGKVKEVGKNESLNTEVLIDLSPDAVVAFSISSVNKTLTALEQSGLKVIYNGDWTEQSPLGKAEWIKFFGALYCKEAKANELFAKIENDYNAALKLAQKVNNKPTVVAGALYENQWYMPQGGSWAALFLKDAGANYLWADSEGTGSLNLSFETVLEKAQDADFWIGPSQFTSLKEMADANPHYSHFKSFQNQAVYSFSTKKGATGGLLYYELAPNRPDLVLKDLISILHPELLPGYELQFFEKLK
ncbi:ABC transporter substrate-binding protein [Flavobacterium sp. Sd200]|uniref:ABC transporter substrate-binding protein n=1 Tax=Flavobacterium sp. Sd200 TaxID=2692211 RepID=UPI00136BD806|nr:ABC transporter substrate-binding protein [Flavobacterium sp. Sd200]MXN91915.1 ABC transporter substrate-binding protein [Flavobacterium sp. Sd200]